MGESAEAVEAHPASTSEEETLEEDNSRNGSSSQFSTSKKRISLKRVRRGSHKIANRVSLTTRKAGSIIGHALHHMLPHSRHHQDHHNHATVDAKPRVRGGVRLRGCLTDEEHRQTTREFVQALRRLKGEEGLRIAGFEYRTVRDDSPNVVELDDSDVPELRVQEEKSPPEIGWPIDPSSPEDQHPTHMNARLFHIESDTIITAQNRKEFIADGDMYDAIASVCQEYAQDVMLKEGNLEWVTISEAGDNTEPIRAIVSSSINTDEDALDNTPTLLIATGKGKVRAGIFSRQHLLLSGMECSTALPIVREAKKRKMNIVMLDPNVHGDRLGMVTFEKSMAKLFQRWEEEDISSDVPPLGKRDLFVLSHSQSGAQFARYLLDKSKHYVPHIRAIAFTDSTHNIQWARQDKDLHQLLESEKSVYFKVSKEDSESSLLTPLDSLGRELDTDDKWQDRFGRISTRCAGTAEHSLTNWFARNQIWDHFDLQLQKQSSQQPIPKEEA